MPVDLIRCPQALHALAPEWTALIERSPAATPFQTPQWLLPWWRALGSGDLFTVAVRDNGRLVALAPMFLHSWNGRRQVTFLGNGVSDSLDFILDPECAAPALNAILACIAQQESQWDLCDLQDLPAESPLARAAPPPGFEVEVAPHCVCSSIPLPADEDSYRAALPHGLRRNLRRYRQQLARQGEVQFETMFETVAPGEFASAFAAFLALHHARWSEKDEAGMLAAPALQSFHAEAASNLHPLGLADLHTLRIGGALIAVVYALKDARRTYSYLGGFDPAYRRFSPGHLILDYAIAQAIRVGAREFDFLRGAEPYKLEWGAKQRMSARLLLRRAAS